MELKSCGRGDLWSDRVCRLQAPSRSVGSFIMEAEKLQRLHDSLSKLAPKGRSGGLGLGGLGKERGAGAKDTSLPQNPLYANFVRAGYFKRKFDDDGDEIKKEEDVVEKSVPKESKKKAKKTDSDKPNVTAKVVIDAALIPFVNLLVETLKNSNDMKSSKKSLQKSVCRGIIGLDKSECKEFFKGLVNLLVDKQQCIIDDEENITYQERPTITIESESESSSDSSSSSDSDSDSSSSSSSTSSSSSSSSSDSEEEEEEEEEVLKWREDLLIAIKAESSGISKKKLTKSFGKRIDGIDKDEKKEMIAGLVNVLIEKSLVRLGGDENELIIAR
jgi:hypothetical protein